MFDGVVSKVVNFPLVLFLASVIAPGILSVVELLVLVTALSATDSDTPLSQLDSLMPKSAAINFFLILALLAASLPLGYSSRKIAFTALSKIESRKPTVTTGLPQRIEERVGADLLRELAHFHPPISRLIREGTPSPSDFEYVYFKLWLRTHAPALNIDSIELEINVLLASILPIGLFLADFCLLVPGGKHPLVVITAVIIALVAIIAIFKSAILMRSQEPWEGLRNFAYEHVMTKAQLSRMASAAQSTGVNPTVP